MTAHAIAEALEHGPVSDADLARRLGVSRERVRQLRNKMGLPTEHWLANKTCPVCGKVFQPKGSGRQFCSRDCSHRSQSLRARVERTCEECGKTFYRRLSEVKAGRPARFCSHRCGAHFLGRQMMNRTERVCEYCGTTFSVRTAHLKRRPARFCSRRCYHRSTAPVK